MILSLFTIETRNDNWIVDIIGIETSNWFGSLLLIGKWNKKFQFDLFWSWFLITDFLEWRKNK